MDDTAQPAAAATTAPPPVPPIIAPGPIPIPAPVAPVTRPARGRSGPVVMLVAFLAGIAVMALLVVGRPEWIGLKRAESVTAASGGTPVAIVPARTIAALPAIDLAALSGRENELAAKLAGLESRAAAIGTDAAHASGYATRAEGLMVAFAARRALDRGLGLGFLEDQLRDRFGASQPRAVATIVQAARDPVTIEDLRAGLDGVAPELVTAAATDGWLTSFRRELGSLFVLHRAGTPSPLPLDRVTRARRLIDAGQVEAALTEVAHTPGAARAEHWTSAARRYIEARRALDVIETAAILAPGVDPVPPAPVPGTGVAPPNR